MESGGLPSRDECLRMLRENGCNEKVVSHCEAVAALAVKIAKRCRADVALVEAGGLLHDLGRCASHGIDHAVRGASLATELKLPKRLVLIIERHVGAGISRSEAKALGLPEKDYVPTTLEEKIVAHSDNLMEGTRRTTVRQATARLVRAGKQEVARKVLSLHNDLSASCGMDVDDIR